MFIKDGVRYRIPSKRLQSEQAFKSGVSFKGREISFELKDSFGLPIPKERLYTPKFGIHCSMCASRPICNGCSDCGKCEDVK